MDRFRILLIRLELLLISFNARPCNLKAEDPAVPILLKAKLSKSF